MDWRGSIWVGGHLKPRSAPTALCFLKLPDADHGMAQPLAMTAKRTPTSRRQWSRSDQGERIRPWIPLARPAHQPRPPWPMAWQHRPAASRHRLKTRESSCAFQAADRMRKLLRPRPAAPRRPETKHHDGTCECPPIHSEWRSDEGPLHGLDLGNHIVAMQGMNEAGITELCQSTHAPIEALAIRCSTRLAGQRKISSWRSGQAGGFLRARSSSQSFNRRAEAERMLMISRVSLSASTFMQAQP